MQEGDMRSLSIRGVDDRLAVLLKQEAAAAHKSMNQFVLELLLERVGLDKKKRFTGEYHDLDHLFGRWTEEEFTRIQGKIDKERRIDEELWT
jgi:hypothetical protein